MSGTVASEYHANIQTPIENGCELRRIVHITYEFPPKGGIGVRRRLKLARYLPAYGWLPSVVTVEDPPTAILEPSLLDELDERVEIHRAWSWEPTRAIQSLKRMRASAGSSIGESGAPASGASYSGMPMWVIRAVRFPFVPDEKRLWKRPAVREATKCAEGAVAIVTSGPPHTAHLAGAALSSQTGLPLICDFEDPWVGNSFVTSPTPIHAWLNRRQEASVVRTATAVVSVTKAMTQEFIERYPDEPRTKFVTIENGFDADDFAGIAPDRPSDASERCVMAYAGTLTPPRTPESFLRGIAMLADRDEGIAKKLLVRFIGAGDEWRPLTVSLGIEEMVRFEPRMLFRESLAAVSGSDLGLLLLSSGPEAKVSLTGKLFEYLGLGKPVFAVVGDGEAARFIRDNRAGVVADYDSPSDIADKLGDILVHWPHSAPAPASPDAVQRFEWSAIARRFSEVLGKVVNR